VERRAVRRQRFVHLATHGFFGPPEMTTAPRPGRTLTPDEYWSSPAGLSRMQPGLLSGITFAGANKPPRPDRDDGILTATEAQELDLSDTELVVLSACETALGRSVQGEGLLGLQRAFQVAGARSLISALWQVDDSATVSLMEEFYTNLWRERLPKLEALRRAQIAVMKHYDTQRQLLEREMIRPPADAVDADPDCTPQRRLPPFYWAAFTLSGDWR
jgi:CHAT domain-containing protein